MSAPVGGALQALFEQHFPFGIGQQPQRLDAEGDGTGDPAHAPQVFAYLVAVQAEHLRQLGRIEPPQVHHLLQFFSGHTVSSSFPLILTKSAPFEKMNP